MKVGDIPYFTPDDDTGADRAKEFCKARGLTSADVKIIRRNGNVVVEVRKNGVRIATK